MEATKDDLKIGLKSVCYMGKTHEVISSWGFPYKGALLLCSNALFRLSNPELILRMQGQTWMWNTTDVSHIVHEDGITNLSVVKKFLYLRFKL